MVFIGLLGLGILVIAGGLRNEGTMVKAQTRVELRCGWFSNPTPANAWLIDRDGEWTIGIQGGYQAEGDWPPEIAESQWVETNGPHGYGCGCIKATFDRKQKRVIKIVSSSGKTLAACRKDPALKKKEPR